MTPLQRPIGSPFGAATTAAEVLKDMNLTGKTVIVTGGYSGIGLEAVRVLARAGAKVTVPARDLAKAGRALAGLEGVTTEAMDLMDPASIAAFAEAFRAANPALDLLINGAAIMAAPLARDARGNESQFSTNVLGHFQLTCQLWPALRASRASRVVFLSSANHRVAIPDLLDDPHFLRTEYDPWQAYARSKAATILLAVAFDTRGMDRGVRAFAVHPGAVLATGLARHMDPSIPKAFGMVDAQGQPIIDPAKGWKTPEQGAATMLWAATSPLLEGKGGVYCVDCEVGTLLAEDEGPLSLTGVTPGATHPAHADRLWHLCEQWSGVRID